MRFSFEVLTAATFFLARSCAHVEDYIIQDSTGTIANFYEQNAALDCLFGETRPACILSAILTGSGTFIPVAKFRGMVHYDGVFVMAQAVGFNTELAYWIAAFAQSADFLQFEAVDSCGRNLPIEYWTPPLRGFLRTSIVTGGTVRHLGIPYGLTKPSPDYTALNPDLDNFEYEGTLSSFRLWARGESNISCHGGFREPVGGNYFVGNTCLTLDSTLYADGVSRAVTGPIPLGGGNMTFGVQIIQYDCLDDPTCQGDDNGDFTIIDPVYATEFGKYLESRPEAKLEDGSTVPEVIARMGVYMHMLADRTSHYYCTDVDQTGIYLRDDGIFDTILDSTSCDFVTHGVQHYWEQAVEQPLAPQSYAALVLYYQELLSFRQLVEADHPDWFVRDPDEYSALVGTVNAPGPLDSAFILVDSQDRFDAVLDVIDSYGYGRAPGFEIGSTASCPFPTLFIKVEARKLPSTSVVRVAVARATGLEPGCVVCLTGEQFARRYETEVDRRRYRLLRQNQLETLYISLSRSCIAGDEVISFIEESMSKDNIVSVLKGAKISLKKRKVKKPMGMSGGGGMMGMGVGMGMGMRRRYS